MPDQSKPEFLPARFTRRDDIVEASLSLMLDNHVDEVWDALTRPDRLVDWLAPGEIDLRLGGVVHLNFAESGIVIDSKVVALEPPRLLVYSWSGPGGPTRPIRWELEPVGAATRLNLTLGVPATEDAARASAGWAAHLDMLAAALAGVPVKFPFLVFKAAQAAYRDQLEHAPAD